jgi:tRNA dimethylallyltransferase
VDGHDYDRQPWSPERRGALAEELEVEGLEPLAGRLARIAPELAARTDLRNPRRVLRALERAEAGDVRPAVARPHAGPVALVALDRPRDVLVRRIEDRARRLFGEAGLLDEVRGLLQAGYGPELGPMTGHGYREAAAHLAGTMSLEEAIARTTLRTRQYAKRQLTWFRRDPRVEWIAAGERAGDDPEIVEMALAALRPALS